MIKKLLFFLAPSLLAAASLIGCSRAEVEFDAETQVKVYDEIYPASNGNSCPGKIYDLYPCPTWQC